MKIKQITLALFLTSAIMLPLQPVQATEDDIEVKQDQKCKQVVEQECEAGAYGQVTSCKQKAEQVCEQRQKVVVRVGKVLGKVHDASKIDTSLDLQSTLAAAAILSTGAGAYALKRKIK